MSDRMNERQRELLKSLGERLIELADKDEPYNVFSVECSRHFRREEKENSVAFLPTGFHMMTIKIGYCDHEYMHDGDNRMVCMKCGQKGDMPSTQEMLDCWKTLDDQDQKKEAPKSP